MTVRIARHPIHPMLVPLPIGLLVFSLVCDLIGLWHADNPAWPIVALYCIGGGVVGALLAAVFGFADFLALSESRARRLAVWHMVANLTVVALFVVSFMLRLGAPHTPPSAILISFVGIALLGVSGWLGGEMVYVHGVGAATTADAPESAADAVDRQDAAARRQDRPFRA